MCIRIVLFIFFSAIVFTSCNDQSSVGPNEHGVVPVYLGDNVDPSYAAISGIGDTARVDSGFTVTFGETVYSATLSAHRQFMTIKTVQWYGCYNTYLIAQVNVNGRKIIVDITGVQTPGMACQDAFGQSEVTEFFLLQPVGYDMEIRYRHQTGHFRLNVTDTSLEATPIVPTIFSLEDSLYWRFRPMSCAIVCGMSYLDTTACGRLMDTLLSVAHLTSYDYPSYGVRPFPRGSSGNYIDWGAQYFIYNSEADFDRVGELLHDYGRANWAWNSGNTAWMVNYRGKQYMSWYPR